MVRIKRNSRRPSTNPASQSANHSAYFQMRGAKLAPGRRLLAACGHLQKAAVELDEILMTMAGKDVAKAADVHEAIGNIMDALQRLSVASDAPCHQND